MKYISTILVLVSLLSAGTLLGQAKKGMTITHSVKTTDVKNQGSTGTCWAYTTVSFLETEALRKGKPLTDLSEMFVVRYAYLSKADYYVRLHGLGNFSQGGQAHDVTNEVRTYGIVPQEAYLGLTQCKKSYDHDKLEADLKAVVDKAAKQDFNTDLSWKTDLDSILDAELGMLPDTFTFENKTYNPKSFTADVLEFNAGDYIEFTSYSHHPFYTKFDLEVPDNWSHDLYYNLPIDELMQTMDHALKNGYSIAWDGDVSEEGFNYTAGTAEISPEDMELIQENDMQTARQITFDNFTTTDDHLMHIVGIAETKKGKKYYLTKNSWGNSNKYGGYLYMSEDFVKLKTIAFMIHKAGTPKEIAKKLF